MQVSVVEKVWRWIGWVGLPVPNFISISDSVTQRVVCTPWWVPLLLVGCAPRVFGLASVSLVVSAIPDTGMSFLILVVKVVRGLYTTPQSEVLRHIVYTL